MTRVAAVLLLGVVASNIDPVSPERAAAIREQAEQTVELVRSLEWCRHQRSIEHEELRRLWAFVGKIAERAPLLTFEVCGTGPNVPIRDGACLGLDADSDWDVDMDDFGILQRSKN